MREAVCPSPMTSAIPETAPAPADDLLEGAAAIAAFTGFKERRVRYLLEKGLLPGGQLGRSWVASKAELARFLAQVTRRAAAE